jgi:membrane protease YdiL (CAAX protease family)
MLSEKPWKLDSVVRLFLVVMTTFCLGALLAALLSHFTSTWPKGQSEFWQIIIGAIFMEIPAVAWIALFLRQHEVDWKDAFGWQMCEPATATAYGVMAAMLFLPAAWGLQMLSEYVMELANLNPQEQVAVQELQDPSLTVTEKAIIGLIAIVFAPIVEEALFRGILYPAIKQMGRPRLALWLSSAVFAAVHFNMVTFLPLMVFALVLVYLYETFQNLLAPIVAHSVFNAANFLYLIFQDQIEHILHST